MLHIYTYKLYYTPADTDECLNNPCLNGATCENLVGSFKCTCPPGFTGERCENSEYREWFFLHCG